MDAKIIEELKESLINKNPILVLGAGFSREALCDRGVMPTGKELEKELVENFIVGKVPTNELDEISQFKLRELCDHINYLNGENKAILNNYLTERFKNVKPNDKGYHNKIINYPWKKIYTLNIDDLVENIFNSFGKKYKILAEKKIKSIKEEETLLIKLHGSVANPENGYIFSKSEYDSLISKRLDIKLNELNIDIVNNDIIFVGVSFDEPDIEQYLEIYKNAGYVMNNSLFFIDPYPTLPLKRKVEQLNAKLIKWNTEEFLNYVSDLSFNPNTVEKLKLNLNYNFIFNVDELKKLFELGYESSIYEGYSCEWQDIYEKWTFENSNYNNALYALNKFLKEKNTLSCFSIYGEAFTGKSTLLKQLGYSLSVDGYIIFEFNGKSFKNSPFLDYINSSIGDKIALLIDNASYYYHEIERLFANYSGNKKIIILTASRIYYHQKKKYYLEGNPYQTFHSSDNITNEDSFVIINKLIEKGRRGKISESDYNKESSKILKKRSLCNLLIELTYGEGFKEKIIKNLSNLNNLTPYERKFLLEIAIFDNANIEIYPRDLFVMRYGSLINTNRKIDTSRFMVVDYIKSDSKGLSLRNSLFHKKIIEIQKSDVVETIKEILIYISRFVVENNNDIWEEIFQSLTQCNSLYMLFNLKNKEVGIILYSIKDYYMNNSYYWLQLGIYEQKLGEYSKALSHLTMSSEIRPNSFKIQHAIALNYLRYANSLTVLSVASPLFEKGEKLMKELIESEEFYKKKAKPFSIHSLVDEKVKYIKKFNIDPTNNELRYLIKIVTDVKGINETYINNATQKLYILLSSLKKLSLLKISSESPFIDYIGINIEDILDYDNIDDIVNSL